LSDADLPDWLRPVEAALDTVTARRLAPNSPAPPDDARPAAVLILFADGVQGPELLLTRRGTTMRNHAGQISFPGGGSDPEDPSAVVTALREAHEEVGLDPTTVEVIGTLPTLWLPPSNFAVTPVLGYWREPEPLVSTSEHEVVEVLHQPIRELIDPANRFSVTHPSGWVGPAFEVGAAVPLWGFTAGIVARLFEVVGWDEPWDTADHRPLPKEAG
jgi:8-oxo-dGTP pyrophosphatase MutT (NUDIX family)